ncbi:MAG: hypothetical protein P4M12_03620 [Gammaproteobacteria bacterium]|nr:hypothetical protein [Gammaproteobacteria bacterium]
MSRPRAASANMVLDDSKAILDKLIENLLKKASPNKDGESIHKNRVITMLTNDLNEFIKNDFLQDNTKLLEKLKNTYSNIFTEQVLKNPNAKSISEGAEIEKPTLLGVKNKYLDDILQDFTKAVDSLYHTNKKNYENLLAKADPNNPSIIHSLITTSGLRMQHKYFVTGYKSADQTKKVRLINALISENNKILTSSAEPSTAIDQFLKNLVHTMAGLEEIRNEKSASILKGRGTWEDIIEDKILRDLKEVSAKYNIQNDLLTPKNFERAVQKEVATNKVIKLNEEIMKSAFKDPEKSKKLAVERNQLINEFNIILPPKSEHNRASKNVSSKFIMPATQKPKVHHESVTHPTVEPQQRQVSQTAVENNFPRVQPQPPSNAELKEYLLDSMKELSAEAQKLQTRFDEEENVDIKHNIEIQLKACYEQFNNLDTELDTLVAEIESQGMSSDNPLDEIKIESQGKLHSHVVSHSIENPKGTDSSYTSEKTHEQEPVISRPSIRSGH